MRSAASTVETCNESSFQGFDFCGGDSSVFKLGARILHAHFDFGSDTLILKFKTYFPELIW